MELLMQYIKRDIAQAFRSCNSFTTCILNL